MKSKEHELLRNMFDAAVDAASPKVCLPPFLPQYPAGRILVIGAGKAASSMANGVEEVWEAPVKGLVITRYGHKTKTRNIEVIEAAHPVPDMNGVQASRRILQMVGGLSEKDLVLCLISGGGSALLSVPASDIKLEEKQLVTKALLRSGATISEINCVRTHLSDVKGGRLAVACFPAQVLTLAISDVPGDNPAIIASGPTIADKTTFSDARNILTQYNIRAPQSVISHLDRAEEESPKPGDHRLANTATHIIAKPAKSLEAAATTARKAGYTPIILGDALEGDSSVLAKKHAQIVSDIAPGTILLSGGETTVVVKGSGKGGPNTEYALTLAQTLNGLTGVWAIACDTDGIDGTEDNAGAIIGPDTLTRAATLGENITHRLEENDSYSFFEAIGDLVISGPTMTNVNDFRAILVTTHD